MSEPDDDVVADLFHELDAGIFQVSKQKSRDDNCLLVCKEIDDIELHLDRKRASKFIDIMPGTNQVKFSLEC